MATLDATAALQLAKLVPGRGVSFQTPEQVAAGLSATRTFVNGLACTTKPTRYPDPRIWTAQRDQEMWQALKG